MAIVQVVTAERTLAIEAATIVGGELDEDGHLILTKGDGSTIDAGSVMGSFANASDTVAGVVELATDDETVAGTDSATAVTPLALAGLTATDARRGLVELATTAEATTGTDTTRAVTPAGLKIVADTKQPADQDLTDVAAITGKTVGDVIGYQAGGWTRRTPTQLTNDLLPFISATGEFVESRNHDGSNYVDADSTRIYVGPVDPGGVPNGSIWFDTTGA